MIECLLPPRDAANEFYKASNAQNLYRLATTASGSQI